MKALVAATLALTAAGVDAYPIKRHYPGCDLKTQHAVKGATGGSITNPRQAHISMRANVLQADLGNARKARRLTQADADRLYRRVAMVRADADRATGKRGAISAREVAAYDRALDAVAVNICRR